MLRKRLGARGRPESGLRSSSAEKRRYVKRENRMKIRKSVFFTTIKLILDLGSFSSNVNKKNKKSQVLRYA